MFKTFHPPHIYILILSGYYIMAATPPSAKKRKMEYNIDQNTYDEFVKACSRKGFAPQVLLEQFMRKFTQTGQV